jgi:hypothetical protein
MSIFQPLYFGVTPRKEKIEAYGSLDETSWAIYLLENIGTLLYYVDAVDELSSLGAEQRAQLVKDMSVSRGWRWPPLSNDEIKQQIEANMIKVELCLIEDHSFTQLCLAIHNLQRQIDYLRAKEE